MARLLLTLLLCFTAAAGSTKLLVTVIEQKSGEPVSGLKPEDFSVLEDKTPRRVEAAEVVAPVVDIMLLLDTSLVGGMVGPVAQDLVSRLQPKEQMAVVSFHSSADLIQDFTSSKELLQRAISKVKYGNTPRVLDALYAAIDGGFQNATFRRAILLLTTGMEGPSRVSERDVIRLARRNAVSIFPVYLVSGERSMFEMLARQTGGASFNLRDMTKAVAGQPGERIFKVLRTHYTLTVSGNLALGERLKVEVKRPEKLFISALPID